MQYTLVAWMRDKPGVLNRVSGMLRRRNFNIDSLQVSHSETPGISRMTFVVDGDERVADQVVKQLRKVVDVTAVEDITNRLAILRELALIRVRTTPATRGEIMQFAEIYRAQIVDVNTENLVVQAVGTEDKVDSLIELLRPFGIEEMVRTGRVALSRGDERPKRNKQPTSIFKAAASLNGSGHGDQE
ncbi:MAG: acetolactate synthase small subunit [Caldilineaceae bacterium]|nr:acetolactate synthase small subunit [Caldilineaceae bacterium]MDE0630941.1 acetolactate synthase small subunit [Caldilineaceae bacterium]MXZ22558.1 acetolactate synthase small subunit [Caldilineaceae bacterium SB0665_bin_25]